MTLPDATFTDELRVVLGTRSMTIEDQPPRLVVRPASTDDVARVVEACAAADVAIVALGGDTGLSQGTDSPTDRPSILLSTARMRRIESVDANRWTLTAQAGVTVQEVQEAAAAVGRQFAPDWGARGTATVGGAIATNAGGNNVVRYGTFRDNVLGLEVVLADGRVWDGRRALRKDASGYDLTRLFVGSEGTLGIVTSAVLKLVPATAHRQSALAAIDGLDDLTALLALAHEAAAGTLTAFELIPDLGIARVADLYDVTRPLPSLSEYCVLVTFASSEPVTDRLARFLSAGSDAGRVIDAVVAATPEQEATLWTIRDELRPPRIFSPHDEHGLKLDVAVPIDRIAELIVRIDEIAADVTPAALSYAFGHVGDGNVHMMILPTTDDAVTPFLAVRPALETAIDALVFELGGTLSAEHGLGLLLRDRARPQKPEIEWEIMRAIKAALDPHDRLNPGKTLPDASS
jgi:FAD/FMN-containing dehydrogenase